MKLPAVLGAIFIWNCVFVALLVADEASSNAQRDLYLKLRLRIFPEFMGKITGRKLHDEIGADLAAGQTIDDLKYRFTFARKALLKDLRAIAMTDPNRSDDEKTRRTKEFHEKYEAELRDILTVEQIERVQQMYLQERGSEALREPDIVEWLELTVAQQRQIQSVHGKHGQKKLALLIEWMELKDVARAAEFQDRRNKIDDERDRNALDVLTEVQRAKYDDLVGKPVSAAKPPSSDLK